MPGLLGSISGDRDSRSVGDPDPDVFGPSGSGSGSGSGAFLLITKMLGGLK